MHLPRPDSGRCPSGVRYGMYPSFHMPTPLHGMRSLA